MLIWVQCGQSSVTIIITTKITNSSRSTNGEEKKVNDPKENNNICALRKQNKGSQMTGKDAHSTNQDFTDE